MGIFIVNSGASVPVYNASGTFGTTNSCIESFDTYDYDTWPIKRNLIIGLGTGPTGNMIINTYTGDAYKTLTLLSFTVKDVPSGIDNPIVGKLYDNLGVEITSFPHNVDIEGLGPGDLTGLRLGHQASPLCSGGTGTGFRMDITFNVTDINGLTGANVTYTVQTTYNP